MANVKIKLNGKELEAEQGKTILEIAREQGIEIPTLCNDDYLEPYGSCWVCVVEVKGKGFVPSCATEIVEGMEIETNNQNVLAARKMALELLLSDHHADCTAPCTIACPAHVDIQGYVALVNDGLYHEAVKLIKEKLPLPLSVGRVCPAFCEDECRRQLIEEPIAIRQIKRYAADIDIEDTMNTYIPEPKPSTGKRVAIIGAGPAGLTVGYYLSLEGHSCTVYEALPEAGGMLRYGIPEFRLPKDILDKEIELIKKTGVIIRNNVRLGRDFTLQFLSKEFDAIFLGLGVQKAMRMNIEGEDLEGCYFGVEFLRAVVEGKIKNIGNTVAVIGGGNTAIDTARTAIRLGAKKVMIIYRRSENEMPAESEEIEAAKEEGIELHLLQNPTKILGKNGKVCGMQCVKMRLGEPDSSGRRRPIPIPNSEFIMELDTVIPAVSQSADTEFLKTETSQVDGQALELTRWNTIDVNPDTMQTNIEKVFAGGDIRRGPSTVIESVADAYIAAKSMHRFLSGEKLSPPVEKFNSKRAESIHDIDPKEYEQYEKQPRVHSGMIQIDERKKTFNEVEKVFTTQEVTDETKRCLECGCAVNRTCKLREYATDYGAIATHFMGEVNSHPIDDTHPFILRDPNKCIKCGLCIRTCLEIQGVGALGYIHRGFSTLVAPEFGESLLNTSCESCGKCIDVCPVGALVSRNTQLKVAPLDFDESVTTCGLCGCGCKIRFKTTDNFIMDAEAESSPITQNNVCFIGRFGYEVLQRDRLQKPLIRKEHELRECSWEEAIEVVRKHLPDLSTTGAIFGSGYFTNEELYLIYEIAKKHKIIRKYSWGLNDSAIYDHLGISYSPNPTSDLQATDLIVLMGNVPHTLGIQIIQAVRAGKRLLVISPEENKFSLLADYHLQSNDYLTILNQIAKYFLANRYHNVEYIASVVDNFVSYNRKLQRLVPDTNYNQAAGLIAEAKKVLFVYSENELDAATQEAILNLSVLKGNIGEEGSGIVAGSELPNKAALEQYGFRTLHSFPAIKSALIFGEDPLFNNKLETYNWLNEIEFLAVGDSYLTETAKMADVVLPLSTFIESTGSMMNSSGVLQKVNKILSSPAGKENRDILSDILRMEMNLEEKVENLKQIDAEDCKEARYIVSNFGKKISLQFNDTPALSKADFLTNSIRKRILDFKKSKLGK
jgi:formate dehydrogenase major subunit